MLPPDIDCSRHPRIKIVNFIFSVFVLTVFNQCTKLTMIALRCDAVFIWKWWSMNRQTYKDIAPLQLIKHFKIRINHNNVDFAIGNDRVDHFIGNFHLIQLWINTNQCWLSGNSFECQVVCNRKESLFRRHTSRMLFFFQHFYYRKMKLHLFVHFNLFFLWSFGMNSFTKNSFISENLFGMEKSAHFNFGIFVKHKSELSWKKCKLEKKQRHFENPRIGRQLLD